MEQVDLMPLMGNEVAMHVSQHLERINAAIVRNGGTFNLEDWIGFLREGKLLLLTVSNQGQLLGEISLERVIYPKRRHLRVVTLSGHNLSNWIVPITGQLRAFARLNGFDGLEATMRPGIARLLWRQGYRNFLTTVTVDA